MSTYDNAELIREKNGIEIYELTPDSAEKLRKHRFYVVLWDQYHNQVQSIVPSDMPSSGTWFANGRNASAIGYVAGGRTRSDAMRWFRKLTKIELTLNRLEG